MSAAVIKGALLQLDKERKAISQEIELAREQLGPVGMSEPLVDGERTPLMFFESNMAGGGRVSSVYVVDEAPSIY
jgi:hypothetical protein